MRRRSCCCTASIGIAHTFDHIAPRFTSRYHVIAMDLRGHGDSFWDAQARYLVEDHVGDLEALVRTLGLRNVTLWGNSTGGRVVQVFAGLHPELVAAVIAEDVGPERPRSIADAYARRVKQEENGWAGPEELLAQMRAAAQPLPDRVLEPYVRYGTKRRDDGRLIWKRDPNLGERVRRDRAVALRTGDQGADSLRARGRQHDRAAADAGGAEEGAAAGAHRHDAGPGALSERRETGGIRPGRGRIPEGSGL
jgi:pimeloyl-ACP methyl ester carboxylesterase